MATNLKLAHALKVKFGLGPNEPSDAQLLGIKNAIQKIQALGEQPTEADWLNAVRHHCPNAGHYKYAGIDNSDLNTLLALAIQAARGK